MKVSQENLSRRRSKLLVAPLNYSLGLISVKSYSEKQVAEKLIKKGFSTEDISRAIKKLKEYGYLDDEKFAGRLIENGKKKLIGRVKMSYELYKKGISKSMAAELMDSLYTEGEEREIAVAALDKKKISIIKNRENELIFKKKLYDFLHWRGFSSGIIEDILNSGID